MLLLTFYRVPKHNNRSNLKFQTQLPTTDPTKTSNFVQCVSRGCDQLQCVSALSRDLYNVQCTFYRLRDRAERGVAKLKIFEFKFARVCFEILEF